MKIEKGRITSIQLIFAIGCFIQGSSLLSSFILGVTLQDTWISVIAGYIISIPIVLMYAALYRKFPGNTLIEINDIVFGPYFGKAISVLYIFFFLSITALNIRDVGGFVVSDIMPETPINAIIIMMIFVCAWAVSKGVETIVSYAGFFVFISAAILIFNGVLLIGDMDMKEFLPIFSIDFVKYVQTAHIVAVIPICEIFSFFMIFPCVKDTKRLGKTLIAGISMGAGTLLYVIVRDIAVIGSIVSILSLASYETIRQIDLAGILSKMEIFFAFILLLLLFFKITVLFYATVMGIAQIFKLRTYTPLVPLVGAIIVSYSLLVFDSPMENAYWGSHVAMFFSTFFEVVIPLMTFILANIRKKKTAQSRTA